MIHDDGANMPPSRGIAAKGTGTVTVGPDTRPAFARLHRAARNSEIVA